MNEFNLAAEALEHELNRMRGLTAAQKMLSEIGSFEDTWKGAKGRAEIAQAEHAAAAKTLNETRAHVQVLKTQGAGMIAAATADAKALTDAAKAEAAKMVKAAETKAAGIIAEANSRKADVEAGAQRIQDALRASGAVH
jgi:hypothetical protein